MFFVPGWNISAALKTQTKTATPSSNTNTTFPQDGEPSLPKKRKRGHGKSKSKDGGVNSLGLGPDVTSENIAEMWERHIEGKKVDKPLHNERPGTKRKSKKVEVKVVNEDIKGDGKQVEYSQGYSNELTILPESTPSTLKADKKKRKKDKISTTITEASNDTLAPPLSTTHLTPLQLSMRAKLASARFRHLNQTLYTTPSSASATLFAENPDMFLDYHTGFSQQVEVWPENPVDGFINAILARGKVGAVKNAWKANKQHQKRKGDKPDPTTQPPSQKIPAETETFTEQLKPLPRSFHPPHTCTLADLGCGTALLSLRLQPHLSSLRLRIHSFDLAVPTGPSGPLVTVADIAALPLPAASVDVAIFCLALMGTNWPDFIDEAYRILRWRGELWVAETKSRFGRVRGGGPGGKGGREVVGHSVGSKNKGGKGKERKTDDDANFDDDTFLAMEGEGIDGAKAPETDVSAFVDVLAKRGFVLEGSGAGAGAGAREGANVGAGVGVDLSNRMFVKMMFVKAAPARRGRNVKVDEGPGPGVRGEGAVQSNRRFGKFGKKVVDAAEVEREAKDEAGVLKPCVYKLR
ncbi:hypothetical protein K432DRAFT_391011 [Lepidopterella palustris CBS 459.81]|uniref:Ribosomal RNA-processing protein 8 n=1 Tax=Lepidopterella palustris CBS 459.81 TaxID=1314670 RepID=A0A8E2EFV0_9PEZI|nr:hypothetical protein K432DRAFT_391011 [Lepidopterella palustris CBS 459.81]